MEWLLVKMLSYNVMRLGGAVKGKYVRRLVQKEDIQLLCIQKTKRSYR